MKKFKKKHTKIPRKEVIVRMLRQIDSTFVERYENLLSYTPEILPLPIRVATLAEFDPNKRQNIRYYPDLHNFKINETPNRSLPIDKFLNLFRTFIDPAVLTQLELDLTNYRLEFYTTREKWIEVYDDNTVDSCMTSCSIVECYSHPQNKLALATLYAPSTNKVVARTIVNTDQKWYVRLFGDILLINKLKELGYSRLEHVPSTFRMYGYAGASYVPGEVHYPYFDFSCSGVEVLAETHNPETGLIEVIINPGQS